MTELANLYNYDSFMIMTHKLRNNLKKFLRNFGNYNWIRKHLEKIRTRGQFYHDTGAVFTTLYFFVTH
jgi:hypothetical protein